MSVPVTTLTDALIWQVVCGAADGQNKVLLGYCALAFGQHPGGGAAVRLAAHHQMANPTAEGVSHDE